MALAIDTCIAFKCPDGSTPCYQNEILESSFEGSKNLTNDKSIKEIIRNKT